MISYLSPLAGGMIIGLSASMLLLFKGRIFGISGILGGVIKPTKGDVWWRLAIIAGLISGGVIIFLLDPSAFPDHHLSHTRLIIAGLLVGFGTQLGGGCTSGHGVCGISRLSIRSITATLTFIIAGILTVLVFSKWSLS